MGARGDDVEARARIGLCFDCRHTRVVRSAKGSVFRQCDRAKAEPEWLAYPPLPVLRCTGFERADADD